ncbi:MULTISPECIES: hypothetical protein [unclassified Streptomyces]|uniref:hypothetical protein n=1 Tax=unclassified Streptomyces TaxID=2593676 RepID=UPI00143E86D7|nr:MULTISPECIES: hypothetical protein [unclassified Streptomyces]QIY66133.1 hypothetical protein HEP85_36965 [Streptomyces sp. RPA4-2]
MVPASRAARNIEVTAGSLHEDLSRLELQKRALERELAAVAAHLDTVHRALRAFEAVLADPPGATDTVDTGRHRDAGRTEGDTLSAPASLDASAGVTRASRQPGGKTETAKRMSRPKVATERTYGRLTEQILDYFVQVGDTDVRARDVAVALGRATDSGSVNAIRSTLDRLVGSSRVRRTGRGLYRAGPS